MNDDVDGRADRCGHAFLAGGGEAAGIIAGFDWAATPLGPIAAWPAHLKTTVSLILRSPVPIVTLWGEDGVMIYNDAYSVFAGRRHPRLFGTNVRAGWPEVADFNDNVMKVGLAGGTLAYRDQELVLDRDGAPAPAWMNLDYSPILDEAGRPCAVMAVVVETTGKVRAEQRLTAERESLRRMFEQAPGMIAMLDGPDHVFTMANAAYLALVGNRDVIGRPAREALPEIEGQGFIALLDAVRASGEAFVGRGVRLLLTIGPAVEERFLDFVYQPIVGEDRGISGIFVQAHDVTEQRLTENALRESEERFRLVAESAPVMLWMGDRTGACVYVNEAQRAFWGVTLEDLPGFDWAATVHPDDLAGLVEPLGQAMAAPGPVTTEARFRRADGEYRIIRTNAQPRFDARGEFVGMIGVNVDMTAVRAAEARLVGETRVLEILNQTGAALAAELDLDRIVQLVTDAGVELVGAQFGAFFYNVLDDEGESYMLYALSGVPREAFAQFAMPRATAIFQPTFKGEGVVRSDDILADPRYGRSGPHHGMPAGHLPVRSYLAVPVASRSGEVLGGLFFGHATPGMFKAEHETLLLGIAGQAATAIDNARLFQALQSLNANLEQRVEDEVARRASAEGALRQAQKMDAIGKLTGGVAHDFNNLLQVVSGNLQLLAKDVAGSERAERRIENAMASVSRGSKLARQLLAFGRRQALEPKVVNIGRLVSGMADMLRRTIGEGVDVDTMVAGGLWNTLIDPGQLEDALLNLAINARDAMDETGKLTIEVGNAFLDDAYAREHADVGAGQYVVLAVTDTGSGMTPDVLAQAFEPFFSTKPQGKGTGLGLSMVYGFVKQSGGHVKIYSEVGQGTTVKLYLPRSHQGEDLATPPPTGPIAGGTETILVAEDDEHVRDTVVEMLGDLGYRVLIARDAESALIVVQSGIPIDLLFTDVVMPGNLRSPELARKARELQPGMAVLFTSGYTENSIVHGGRLDAGVELLSKPYTREALARKVRHVLANQAQRRRADAPRPGAALAPLPAAPVPAAPVLVAPALVTPVPVPAADLTVLLCEDDDLVRMATADMLAELGLRVIEAATAAEALARVEAAAVDVLVTDVGLPDLSGLELAARVRAIVPALPILFATGHAFLPEAAALGRTAVVAKPYDAEELGRMIRRLVVEGAGR
ncbi:PAS domain S-box-containing protein [Stella humosa]|uniref:histidine kinase n=1 Tax=Stella humosa TaxID=94 RepID=A0A3N1MBF1_9PROT|nr:response regulator [Stella humosa]ROQ00375.1 PAS domain S-box-containing protein [Stella humosa]BBK30386.1 hypothetical protein STHU_10200 [Stella humosa]